MGTRGDVDDGLRKAVAFDHRSVAPVGATHKRSGQCEPLEYLRDHDALASRRYPKAQDAPLVARRGDELVSLIVGDRAGDQVRRPAEEHLDFHVAARWCVQVRVLGLRAADAYREGEEGDAHARALAALTSEVDPSDEEAFGYFSGAFEELKALINRGVDRGQGMLVWLTQR
jgi:hypothetical protein